MDVLIVAVYDRPVKSLLFSPQERLDLARASLSSIEGPCEIIVEGYSSLTVQYACARGANAIVRGLRTVNDFEAEYQMTSMNRHLAPDLETLFFMTSSSVGFLSASLVKEVASGGGDVQGLVPPPVAEALARRIGRCSQ